METQKRRREHRQGIGGNKRAVKKLGATHHQPESIRNLEDRPVLRNSNTKKVEHALEMANLYSYIQ